MVIVLWDLRFVRRQLWRLFWRSTRVHVVTCRNTAIFSCSFVTLRGQNKEMKLCVGLRWQRREQVFCNPLGWDFIRTSCFISVPNVSGIRYEVGIHHLLSLATYFRLPVTRHTHRHTSLLSPFWFWTPRSSVTSLRRRIQEVPVISFWRGSWLLGHSLC